jgi:Ion channel
MKPGEHGYGVLLVLIITSLIFQLATDEGDVAHIVTILLVGGTFLAALWTSQARARPLWIASAIVVAVTLGAALAFAASGEVNDTGARIVSLLMVALAPIAIVHGLVRHFREEGRVTVQTMFGVLCIYLLLGSLFAFVYGILDEVGSSAFFAQIANGDTSDYLYFSFSTLTTTGYGDLTAGTDLGRSFAITEQLLGQIYLVTVVAVIIGNLSRARRAR